MKTILIVLTVFSCFLICACNDAPTTTNYNESDNITDLRPADSDTCNKYIKVFYNDSNGNPHVVICSSFNQMRSGWRALYPGGHLDLTNIHNISSKPFSSDIE